MFWYLKPWIYIWIAGYIIGYSWNDAILSHCMQFLIISLEFKFWRSFSLKTVFCSWVQIWLKQDKGRCYRKSTGSRVLAEVETRLSSLTKRLLPAVSEVWQDVQFDRKSTGNFISCCRFIHTDFDEFFRFSKFDIFLRHLRFLWHCRLGQNFWHLTKRKILSLRLMYCP